MSIFNLFKKRQDSRKDVAADTVSTFKKDDKVSAGSIAIDGLMAAESDKQFNELMVAEDIKPRKNCYRCHDRGYRGTFSAKHKSLYRTKKPYRYVLCTCVLKQLHEKYKTIKEAK